MRRKNKVILIWIIVILTFGGIAYAFGSGVISIPKINLNFVNFYPLVSMKDLTQNPQNYVGKNISISGNMYLMGNGAYTLQDSDGYFVVLEDNCKEQRNYFVQGINTDSPHTYTAVGIFTAPKDSLSLNPFNTDTEYTISCSSPIN